MNKFSQTIHNLYNKILPIAEQSGVELDLDYSDPATIEFDVETDDPELKAELEKELKNAITRTNSGSIKLKVANGAISITDTGTILSRPLCESLSHGRVSVKSRVGFGTNINISLAKADKTNKEANADTASRITADDKPKLTKSTKKH